MLDLFVRDATSGEKVPAVVSAATEHDLAITKDWQTSWETPFAHDLPNKVALRRADDGELLGLMSYELYDKGLAVEIIYMENARHSNANLLHAEGGYKRYYGIAKALFAYAIQVSLDAGFDGILIFKAKTRDLLDERTPLFEHFYRKAGFFLCPNPWYTRVSRFCPFVRHFRKTPKCKSKIFIQSRYLNTAFR